MTNDDKLSLINYIIFLYSEDVFLSKEIPENILKDKKLVEVSQLSSIAFLNFSNSIDDVKKIYDLSKYREIPNLLSEKYKLR